MAYTSLTFYIPPTRKLPFFMTYKRKRMAQTAISHISPPLLLKGSPSFSISYIDGAGSRNYKSVDEKSGIMKQVDLNAQFVLFMSAIQENLRYLEVLESSDIFSTFLSRFKMTVSLKFKSTFCFVDRYVTHRGVFCGQCH